MSSTIKIALISSAITGLFACSTSGSDPKSPSGTEAATVRCQGVNSCKGMAECSGNGHPCGKHTPCKGQGWVSVPSAADCVAKGGTVL